MTHHSEKMRLQPMEASRYLSIIPTSESISGAISLGFIIVPKDQLQKRADTAHGATEIEISTG